MPLPGESILSIQKILSETSALICARTYQTERDQIDLNIQKSKELLAYEEMEILRFGDVTRTADDTFEPYQTVKKAREMLENFPHWSAIPSALRLIEEYIESDQYAESYPDIQVSIF
jgi:hypothetical protein